MSMLQDVKAALELIPIWKELSAMPARVRALEARIAALEVGKRPDTPMCPGCHIPLSFVTERKEDGPFGDLGARERVWNCSGCGTEVIRKVRE